MVYSFSGVFVVVCLCRVLTLGFFIVRWFKKFAVFSPMFGERTQPQWFLWSAFGRAIENLFERFS